MKHNAQIQLLSAVFVFFVAASSVYGQTVQQQPAPPAPQQQGGLAADPIRQLNLTPEQREQIRAIREQSKEERAAINQRVREANRALEEALDSDNPDEALIEQPVRDAVGAQAAAMRIRILTEVRIRRVLTLEQRNLLRTLRLQARQFNQDRFMDREQRRRQRLEEHRALPNQRDGLAPLFPRRGDSQRRPRP
jgi:Spy/CpxP family protein refolding chaperone